MLTVDELLNNANDYLSERISLERFDRWFEENADSSDDPVVGELYDAIEGAFSEYYFDHVGQDGLKTALRNAIRPFRERESAANEVVLMLKFVVASTRSAFDEDSTTS